jgi:hypothetical protein
MVRTTLVVLNALWRERLLSFHLSGSRTDSKERKTGLHPFPGSLFVSLTFYYFPSSPFHYSGLSNLNQRRKRSQGAVENVAGFWKTG